MRKRTYIHSFEALLFLILHRRDSKHSHNHHAASTRGDEGADKVQVSQQCQIAIAKLYLATPTALLRPAKSSITPHDAALFHSRIWRA